MSENESKKNNVGQNDESRIGEFNLQRFSEINKLIARDMNNIIHVPTFSLYNKDDISKFLRDPNVFQRELRRAITYIYGASPHFRRLIEYFVGLSDFAYVVSPHHIDPKNTNTRTLGKNYRRVLNTMSSMNVKSQFPKILTVCLREDTFYGTMWIGDDNITIQQLPPDFCAISTIEDNVFNVTFDFSYFDQYKQYLEYYPQEFKDKYERYMKNRRDRWIELDSPLSFAVKCNNEILEYPLPPFAGILREVYDLEDYKQLKLAKTALENYAILVMKDAKVDDVWEFPYEDAKKFWRNLDAVLPEEVGSILSPLDIQKISFEKSNTGDTDTIADAEQNLFSAAGVSSLLFNNDKASANALTLSIKADQAITFGIVRSIEDVINRYLHSQSFGKSFKVTFLDCSPYNRKELGDQYLKACQYSLPFISMYAASQGLTQDEVENMSFLENDVLGLSDSFKPLQSSSTLSAESQAATDEGGAPEKDTDELSESGEDKRERK